LALIETIEDYDSLVNVENEDQQFGLNVVFKAVYEPFNKIIFNSGKNSEVILTKLLEQRKENKNLIYDAKDHKIVDAYQSGIVDPTKVIRCALQNAASAAIVLLTSNFAICDE
jgi:chaperonin GroEL